MLDYGMADCSCSKETQISLDELYAFALSLLLGKSRYISLYKVWRLQCGCTHGQRAEMVAEGNLILQ